MHNESRVIYSRCQSATSWRLRYWKFGVKDEEIRADELKLDIELSKYPFLSPVTPSSNDFSSISQFCRSTVSPHEEIALHCVHRAYLCVALPRLQPSLYSFTTWYVSLPPCAWLSLSVLQHLLSEISLSPVRWCRKQPSLFPLFPSYLPCFPLSLSPLSHIHACILLSVFILRRAQAPSPL